MFWLYVPLVALGAWVAFEWLRHLYRIVTQAKATDFPPLVSGIVPFLGAAIKLGRGPPVDFLRQCREAARAAAPERNPHGCFTLHAAGRSMTFVFDPTTFDAFFDPPTRGDGSHDSDIDFRFATQPFLTRGFGVRKDLYFAHHESLLQTVRTVLTPNFLREYYTEPLLRRLYDDMMNSWPLKQQQQQEAAVGLPLYDTMHCSIFHASLSVLFGESFAQSSGLSKAFHTFDSTFELASSPVPHILLPHFTSAKDVLLKALTQMLLEYEKASEEPPPLVAKMRDALGSEGLNHWLLALVWAAEANTIPTSFWTIIRLLEHPEYLSRVVQQIDEVVASRSNSTDIPQELFTYDELQRLSLLQNAIEETIRLQAPPILLRGIRGDNVMVSGFKIPRGNYLCLSPYWSHRDEQLFHDAETWNPERFENVARHKVASVRFGNLSFGNGNYRCPGKFFAQFELAGLLALILRNYSIEWPDAKHKDVPSINRFNLVGITKPANDVRLIFRRRHN